MTKIIFSLILVVVIFSTTASNLYSKNTIALPPKKQKEALSEGIESLGSRIEQLKDTFSRIESNVVDTKKILKDVEYIFDNLEAIVACISKDKFFNKKEEARLEWELESNEEIKKSKKEVYDRYHQIYEEVERKALMKKCR